jgi:E3 ubiquitin-protein ligase TRIP12
MQLSNEPAEELAKILVDSGGKDSNGNNVFELCGFVSGGSEAMEGVIKLARQVRHGVININTYNSCLPVLP